MVYITSTPNHDTPHYPHDPWCEHRNCPECAAGALRIMLADQRRTEAIRAEVTRRPTTTRAQRHASRFRPMGVR